MGELGALGRGEVECGSRERESLEEEQPSSERSQQHAEIRTVGSAARFEVTRDLASTTSTKLARWPNAGAVLVARPLPPQLAIAGAPYAREHGAWDGTGSMEAWKRWWKLWAQAVAHQESAGQMRAPMASQRSPECHHRWRRPSIAPFLCSHDPRNPSSVRGSTSAASPAAVSSPIGPCHQPSTA